MMEPTAESLRDHHAIIWNRLAISWCAGLVEMLVVLEMPNRQFLDAQQRGFFQNQEELCFPENKQNLAESVGYFWRYTDLHAYIYIYIIYIYILYVVY